MVDYPNNPPAGQSGTRNFGTVLRNAVDPLSDPTTTRLAQNNYAAGLQPAAAQGSGSSGTSALSTTQSAPAASAGGPAATKMQIPPSLSEIGKDTTKATTAASPAASSITHLAVATPFHALPASWQSKLHETFGEEAPTRYQNFRAQSAVSLAGGPKKDQLAPRTPQEQMEGDFGDIAAGRGRSALPGRDYRTGVGMEPSGPPSGTILPPSRSTPDLAAIRGNIDAATAAAPPIPSSPQPTPAATMTPHVPVGFEGNPAFQPSPTGAITPSELTATDAFGAAQVGGKPDIGGPAGPPADPGMMAEQPIGPGSTITVKPGDNLWNIARTYLGDPTKAKEIAQLNGVRHPNMIHPGLKLRLPGGMDPANVATPRVRPGAPAAAPPPEPPPQPPPQPPPTEPPPPPPQPLARTEGGPPGGGGMVGQGEPDELDDLTHAAATRAHEILGQASLNDYDTDEYPFRSGGGGVVTPPPASASTTTSPGSEPAGPSGSNMTPSTRMYPDPSAVNARAGELRNDVLRRDLERLQQARQSHAGRSAMPSRGTETAPAVLPEGQAKWDAEDQAYDRSQMGKGMQPNRWGMKAYPDKFYDPDYRGVNQMNPNNRYMEDIVPGFKESETQVSALSANDNGLPGVLKYTPGSRLPLPYQPNIMPDYLRGKVPLPVSKPANLAAAAGANKLAGGPLKDILQANLHEYQSAPPGRVNPMGLGTTPDTRRARLSVGRGVGMSKEAADKLGKYPTREQAVAASMREKRQFAADKVGGRATREGRFDGWITPQFWNIPMDVMDKRSSGNIHDLRSTPGAAEAWPWEEPLAKLGNRIYDTFGESYTGRPDQYRLSRFWGNGAGY